MEHNDLNTYESSPKPRIKKNAILADYKIKRKLGEGSFGCVYQGKHVLTKQKVALKLVAIRSSHHRELVIKEASILRHLQNEEQEFHILQLLDVIEISREEFPLPLSIFPGSDQTSIRNIVCIVTEYIRGGDMIDHVQDRTRLKEEEAAKLFRQLLVAVQWCHLKGVIHRDIKLENLMMASKSCLKLIDFGLSQYVEENDMVTNFVGSIAYTAPEVFRGDEYDGAIADIWSCGVVLYAMVTGEFPWEGIDGKEQAKNIIKGRWISPNVSAECHSLLKAILTVDPAMRLTLPEIISHPWMQKHTAASPKRLSAERGAAAGKQEPSPTPSPEIPRLHRLTIGLFRKKQSASNGVVQCSSCNT